MVNTTGTSGAAPIWSQFMENGRALCRRRRHHALQASGWHRGQGHLLALRHGTLAVVQGRALGGLRRRPGTPAGQPGPAPRSAARHLDRAGGLGCLRRGHRRSVVVINVKDEWARKWFETRDGRDWLRRTALTRRRSTPRTRVPQERSAGHAGDQCRRRAGHLAAHPGTAGHDGCHRWIQVLDAGVRPGREPGRLDHPGRGQAAGQQRVRCSTGISPTCSNQTITLHLYMKGEDGYAEKTVHFTLGASHADTRRRPRRPRRRDTPPTSDTATLPSANGHPHARRPQPKRRRPDPAHSPDAFGHACLLHISRAAGGRHRTWWYNHWLQHCGNRPSVTDRRIGSENHFVALPLAMTETTKM